MYEIMQECRRELLYWTDIKNSHKIEGKRYTINFEQLLMRMKMVMAGAVMLAALLPVSAKRLERDLDKFTKIRVTSAYDVKYVQGDKYKVVIEGEEEQCMECTETRVTGDGVLEIRPTKKFGLFGDEEKNDKAAWKITVTAPTLEGIECSGASDFYTDESLDVSSFSIEISGASDAVLGTVVCDELEIKASGASDLNIRKSAKVKSASLKASGSSDIIVNELSGNEIDADVSGSSDVRFNHVSIKNALVNASGSADVVLRGTINNLTQDASGAASIRYRKL